jgi:hypothetical protein
MSAIKNTQYDYDTEVVPLYIEKKLEYKERAGDKNTVDLINIDGKTKLIEIQITDLPFSLHES